MVYLIPIPNGYRSAGDYDFKRGWFRDYDNNFVFHHVSYSGYGCIGKLVDGNLEPLSEEDKNTCQEFGWVIDEQTYDGYIAELMIKCFLDDEHC